MKSTVSDLDEVLIDQSNFKFQPPRMVNVYMSGSLRELGIKDDEVDRLLSTSQTSLPVRISINTVFSNVGDTAPWGGGRWSTPGGGDIVPRALVGAW